MPEIIEGVSPTRMELLSIRRKEKIAEKGHDLLREKRDALIAEFLDLVGNVRGKRTEVENKLSDAFTFLLLAQMRLGVEEVKQLSLMTQREIPLDIATRSIMGVNVPILEPKVELTRSVTDRGYGFMNSSAAVDNCARSFEEALERIVSLAELEEAVRTLAEEVEKTKRRVNALEYVVIPRLKATRKYIQMRLEEMERENFARLKKIKVMLERK
ncbi:MAG: V-type ATP synthase subunit D [Methanophagales archaeon]|nr:V-type ATP synthase subunit D [Methanophagales archaeon]